MVRFWLGCAAVMVAGLLGMGSVWCDDAPPPPANGGGGGGGGGGGRGGRGNFDPAAIAQRRLNQVKDTLGVSDDDWKAMQPKVEDVIKVQNETRMAGFGGMRGRRGGNNPDATPPAPTNDVEKKTQELRTLLEKPDVDPKAVKDKLTELRAAKETSKGNLKKAQDALRELLTQKQEAQLVLQGILE